VKWTSPQSLPSPVRDAERSRVDGLGERERGPLVAGRVH
jgi:hypothetical protein